MKENNCLNKAQIRFVIKIQIVKQVFFVNNLVLSLEKCPLRKGNIAVKNMACLPYFSLALQMLHMQARKEKTQTNVNI